MRKVLLVGGAVALALAAVGAGVIVAREGGADSVEASPAAGPGVSPETFARVATGVALIGLHDCAGKPLPGPFGNDGSGTGFLIGSRLLMTAEHVVQGAAGHPRACGLRARIGRRWYEVEEAKAWRDHGQNDSRGTDLATLQLAAEARGHVFELNRVEASVGNEVAALGYPLGLPLSFTQGFLTKKLTDYGKPTLAASMVIADGSSGGPIIDRSGRVVSVVTRVVVWANQTDGATTMAAPTLPAGGETQHGTICAARILTAASPTAQARSLLPRRTPSACRSLADLTVPSVLTTRQSPSASRTQLASIIRGTLGSSTPRHRAVG